MKKFVYVPAFNPEYFKQGHPYQLVHRDHPTEACVAILKSITANHLEFIFINSNGMIQSFHLNIEDTNVVTVSRLVADPEDEEGVEIPTEAKPEPKPQTQTQSWNQPQQMPINPTETVSMSDQQITPGTFVENRQTKERFAIWSVDTDKVYLRSLDHEDNVTTWLAPIDLMRDFIRVGIMSLSVEQWNRFEAYTDNRSRAEPNQPQIQQTTPPSPLPINQPCKFKVGDVIAPMNVIGPAITFRIQEMIVNPMTHNVDYAIIKRTDNSGDDMRIEIKILETQYKIVTFDDDYGVNPIRPIRFA